VTRFNNPWDSETRGPWISSNAASGTAPVDAPGQGMEGLDAPMSVGDGGNARDLVFNSPLPPPVTAAAAPTPAPVPSESPAVGGADVEMS
jgi:hypothetical protein